MDVDEDIDSGLLRQFNCMNTDDKDTLMRQLQSLVGIHLNEQSAKFYLDMTDWNLQAAVCAYFDLQSGSKLPQMNLLNDITTGEGESISPNTRFIKKWRIKNCGEDLWPFGCRLKFSGGEKLGAPDHIPVDPLLPGTEAEISLEMVSPSETGYYSSKWRMSTSQGYYFGDSIWVIILVDIGGTLGLTQQMMNFKDLGSSAQNNCLQSSNPFANSKLLSHASSEIPATEDNRVHLLPTPNIPTMENRINLHLEDSSGYGDSSDSQMT